MFTALSGVRLVERPLDLPAIDHLGQVEQRPRHRGAGDSVDDGGVGRRERDGAVEDDAGVAAAVAARDRYLRRPVAGAPQAV
jgi:hypothetical protein